VRSPFPAFRNTYDSLSFGTSHKKTFSRDLLKTTQKAKANNMKRSISDTIDTTAFCSFEINTSSLLKRRKTHHFEPTITKHTVRVRFAAQLVQSAVIPAIADQEEKNRRFYSGIDFARFAFDERVRRDAIILTVTLCREQVKRLRRRANVVAPPAVTLMYHKILNRPQEASQPLQRRSKAPRNLRTQRPTNQSREESHISTLRSRVVVARVA
jgi:hypothetical protein